MIRERDHIRRRGDRKLGNATDVARGDDLRFIGSIGALHGNLLEAAAVGDGRKPLAVLEPLRQPRAHAAAPAMLQHGALKERHREGLAARNEG